MRESVTTRANPFSRAGFPRFPALHKADFEGERLIRMNLCMSDGSWVFINGEGSHLIDLNTADDATTPVLMIRILRKPHLEFIPHSRDGMKLASSESVHPAPDDSSVPASNHHGQTSNTSPGSGLKK
jgi:hypothetical protein